MSYKLTFGKIRIECDTFAELQNILDYEASRTGDESKPEWSQAAREQFKAGLPIVSRKIIQALEKRPEGGLAMSAFSSVAGKKVTSPGPLFISIYTGLRKLSVPDPKGLILKERRQGEIFYKLSDRYFSDD